MLHLILAGNVAQAREYARLRGWGTNDYRIVNYREQLMGLEGFTLHRVGTWESRPDALQMMELARTRRNVKIVDEVSP